MWLAPQTPILEAAGMWLEDDYFPHRESDWVSDYVDVGVSNYKLINWLDASV